MTVAFSMYADSNIERLLQQLTYEYLFTLNTIDNSDYDAGHVASLAYTITTIKRHEVDAGKNKGKKL